MSSKRLSTLLKTLLYNFSQSFCNSFHSALHVYRAAAAAFLPSPAFSGNHPWRNSHSKSHQCAGSAAEQNIKTYLLHSLNSIADSLQNILGREQQAHNIDILAAAFCENKVSGHKAYDTNQQN